MFSKLVQLENAYSSILVRPSGNSTLVRPVHPENALLLILVTVLGKFMLTKFLLLAKAEEPILVKPFHPSNLLIELHP